MISSISDSVFGPDPVDPLLTGLLDPDPLSSCYVTHRDPYCRINSNYKKKLKIFNDLPVLSLTTYFYQWPQKFTGRIRVRIPRIRN